ncbi:3-dehydroquinate synthase [Candidatus Rhodoluna planktonica]|uniref:3-dehydroquinate synthase n=1 Tax=Candidatus Rhodoluna planktonica TaxID=535712 RepID=A0A1D9DZ15_9MICO|nr:3-dehydroquinate synthase [Candidatus Rhodoluna planktonica]AOY56052.1 3-dehydroquinate synthase [Candidatus Rhodoluna planktonica]
MSNTITVSANNPYPVIIGRALLGELAPLLGEKVAKVLVIHPVGLSASAELVKETLEAAGYECLLAGVPDSEDAKRVEVAAFCWTILGQADFTRSDAVIGFGGGSTTDLAGFVAATWLRGVRLIQIPTTLLGMVDASVGGKTGINTSEGKNLVGAFHSPSGVLVDLDALQTLAKNEILAGFAEVVKYGFIADPVILDLIENNLAEATDPSSDVFEEIVSRSIQIKSNVVGVDFKENGLREILNYGHTLGHAIELAERYKWRHGAAISIGMVFVAELARLAGRLPDAVVDRHRSILTALGLPISYPAEKWPQLLATMKRDKKARGANLRFIVLDDLAKPTVMTAPTEEMLFAAFQEITA